MRRCVLVSPIVVMCLAGLNEPQRAFAQTCPNPAVISGAACTVPPGTTITVSTVGGFGLNASGAGGQITANVVTLNLAAATTTGGLAQSGASIFFDGSSLATTATTTATSATQTGFRATGSGSTVSATGSTIRLGPSNGTTTASNLTGAAVDSGGAITLTNTSVQMLGGPSGVNNRGLVASGPGSEIVFSGAAISTMSRNSTAVQAQAGGSIDLSNAQIATTGAGTTGVPSVGSHGLYALDAGSQITGTGLTIGITGTFSNGARAEGGSITLTDTIINSSSTSAADTDPASLARVMGGGFLQLNTSTLNGTGQRGNGVSVQDAGSQAVVNDTTISVTGNRAPAAFIFNGGQATFTDSSLLSVNSSSVVVQDAGSSITLTDTAIRSQGAVGYGLRVINGASATMTNGSVTTEGRDGPGFYAANATIVGNNVTIATSGSDNAMGALADGNGNITMNGGSVTTSGDSVRVAAFAHGVAARNPGGTLTANGTTIVTTGLTGMGAVADDGGTVNLNGNAITTSGISSIGLYATVEQAGIQFPAAINANTIAVETSGALAHGVAATQHFLVAPSVINIGNSAVTTHGDGAEGMRATMAATVNGANTTVSTEGANAYGLHSRDNGSSINLDLTAVLATGAAGHGAVAEGGGLIGATNSMVRATGANASALFVAGAPGFVGVANFTGSSLTNANSATIGVAGNGDVSLTNSFAGGSGQWLKVATLNDFAPLTAPLPELPGISDPEGLELPTLFPPPAALPVVPGLANVTVSNSTVVGSAFTAPGSVSNVSLLNNSLWSMTGSSNLTNLINDPSLIQFSPPTGNPTQLASYMTLTVVNYTGLGGGIGLNTYLGTDGSPSDRLVIDGGAATGTSFLSIANTVGPGARTTGNGILVVDAVNGGTTTPGLFFLSHPVVAGPYEYGLFRSSLDLSNPEAWYLRTTGFRQETSLYPVIPAVALSYGRALLDTLHERIGEDAWPGLFWDTGAKGAWARIIGQIGHNEGTANGSVSGSARYDYHLGAIQFGHDFYRKEHDDNYRDQAGLFGAIGTADADVTHSDGLNAGTNSYQAYSFGGYWTRFSPSGGYVDAVGQLTWYSTTGRPAQNLPSLKTTGIGLAASIEAGQPIQIGDGWIIEPQAQLVYQTIDLSDGHDSTTTVRFSDVESLTGRIGARLARTWLLEDGANPRFATIWIRPNLWHEFAGKPAAEFSSATGFIAFHSNLARDTLEINGGVTAQISQATSLYANASYQRGLDNDSWAYSGKIGLKTVW